MARKLPGLLSAALLVAPWDCVGAATRGVASNASRLLMPALATWASLQGAWLLAVWIGAALGAARWPVDLLQFAWRLEVWAGSVVKLAWRLAGRGQVAWAVVA
eukprot:29871-Alexandrium_andersonii.AAC.1